MYFPKRMGMQLICSCFWVKFFNDLIMVHVYYTFLLSFHVERMRKSICNQSITIASLRDTVISQRTRMSSQSERMQNIQRKLEVKIINSFNVKIVIENFINFLDVLKKKIIMFIARTLLIKNSLNSRHACFQTITFNAYFVWWSKKLIWNLVMDFVC